MPYSRAWDEEKYTKMAMVGVDDSSLKIHIGWLDLRVERAFVPGPVNTRSLFVIMTPRIVNIHEYSCCCCCCCYYYYYF